MVKKGMFGIKIKYDGVPVVQHENISLEEVEEAVKTIRRKVR